MSQDQLIWVLTGIIIVMIIIHLVVQRWWWRDHRNLDATEALLEAAHAEGSFYQRKFNEVAKVATTAAGLMPYLDMSFDTTGMSTVEVARSRAAEYQRNVLVRSLGEALNELGAIDFRSWAEYQADLVRALATDEHEDGEQ